TTWQSTRFGSCWTAFSCGFPNCSSSSSKRARRSARGGIAGGAVARGLGGKKWRRNMDLDQKRAIWPKCEIRGVQERLES
ncbi:hypothetical protein BCR44DRAFT_1443776, partial [Catenaria anguillulae PL171]